MTLTNNFPALTLSLMVAAGSCAAPAWAQVLQIGDDGTVVTHAGPVVTTAAGVAPIMLMRSVAPPMMRAPGAFDAVFAGAARDSGVDQRLLQAVAWHESRFRQDAVSQKGAIGVMQLMPGTAQGLGVDPHDPVQNIRGGALLLGRLLRQYRGDVSLTLAAYNAGPDAVRRYGGIPPFAETMNYVAKIKRFLP